MTRSPFRDRNFRLWFSAETLLTVSMSSQLAVSLLLIDLAGSLSIAGFLSSAIATTELLAGAVGGAFADRYARKRVIRQCILTSVASIVILICVILSVQRGLLTSPWLLVSLLCLATIVIAASEALADPSMDAALKELITPEQYPRALSAAQARTSLVSLGSRPIVGFLYGITPILPFIIRLLCDSSFLLLLNKVTTSFDPPSSSPPTGRRGLGSLLSFYQEAWEHIRRDPVIRIVILCAPLVNLMVFTGMNWTVFSLRDAGNAPAVVGLVTAGFSLGSVLGALVAPRLTDHLGSGRLASAGLIWMSAVFFMMFSLADNHLLLFALAVLSMIPSVSIGSGLFAHVFARTPSVLQGRTLGVFTVVNGLATISAPTLAAFAVEHDQTAALAAGLGLLSMTGIAMLILTPQTRQLPALKDLST